MIRWLRIAVLFVLLACLFAVGGMVGLVLVENDTWVGIRPHPLFAEWVGGQMVEVRLPVLICGWVLAVLATAVLVYWSMWYVWRRRQYESLVRRLEAELIELRAMPFLRPAALSDQPVATGDGDGEAPDPRIARRLQGTKSLLSDGSR